MLALILRVHPPYRGLARVYDRTIGAPAFRAAAHRFDILARRHALAFRSAADVGCGTGLFASYLARRFRVPVFAVDSSPDMLAVARRRGAGVTLLRQDMRRLSLPYTVDLITMNFDALNHIPRHEDLAPTMDRLARALRPGGHLLFDVLADAPALRAAPCRLLRVRSCRGEFVQRLAFDPAARVLRTTVVERGAREAILEHHREVVFTPQELSDAMARAGLVVKEALDADTLAPAREIPTRLLVLAQRPENPEKPAENPRTQREHRAPRPHQPAQEPSQETCHACV